MRKKLLSIIVMVAMCCLIFSGDMLAYDDIQRALSDNFDDTSWVEQGYQNLKKNEPNCRFCYAYDYDGDGRQEGYALSGRWQEGIVNGKLWFIDSNGTYSIIKEGIYCNEDFIEPELVYAGKQIFLVQTQIQNEQVVSIVCGYRNGKVYFPEISERVIQFHSELGHYYAYNLTDCSGEEFFFDETTGEFKNEKLGSREINVVLNGKKLEFDQPPVMAEGDRVIVPVRAIFEAMGATVSWDGNTKTAIAKKGTITVTIQVGQYYLVKNGLRFVFDCPAQIINDRTLVPIRAAAEAFGATVTWDGNQQIASIDTSPKINAIVVNADNSRTGNDASIVRSMLLNNKLAKVDEENFHSAIEPSEEYFNKIVDTTAIRAGESDITYFFYSGHGDDKGNIYIDNDKFSLSPQELINELYRIPGTIVIILNSCHSGAINNLNNINKEKFKIITACKETESSEYSNLAVFSSEQIGSFPETLLDGLGGLEGTNIIYNSITDRDGKVKADYDSDCKVTLSELFKYIDANMDKTYVYEGNIYSQNPTCSNPGDDTVIYAY